MRGHRAGDAVLKTPRAAVRGRRARGRHGRPRGRRRVRRALHRDRRATSARRARRTTAQRAPSGRSASTAPQSRSTEASAGPVYPDDGTTCVKNCSPDRRRADVRNEAGHERRDGSLAAWRRRRRSSGTSSRALEQQRAPRRVPADHRPRHRHATLTRRLWSVACCRTARSCRRPSSCPHVERTPLVRELTVRRGRGRAALRLSSGRRRGMTSASRSTSRTGSSTIRSSRMDSATMLRLVRPRAARSASRSRLCRPGRAQADTAGRGERSRGFAALGVRLSPRRRRPRRLVRGAARSPARRAEDRRRLRSRARQERLPTPLSCAGSSTSAHALGLEVVAEGVETRDAWSVLAGLGLRLRTGLLRREPANRRTSSSEWLRR